MPRNAFPTYQNLISRNDSQGLDAFIQKHEQIRYKDYRLYHDYNEEVRKHYLRKTFHIDTAFLLLHRILELKNDNFRSLPVNKLSIAQLQLFELENSKQNTANIEQPSMVLTGQGASYKYAPYSGINHLGYQNIVRLVRFFEVSRLYEADEVIDVLLFLNQKNRSYSQFLNHYQRIKHPKIDSKTLQNLIWLIDEDKDWEQFQYDRWSLEEFCEDIRQLYLYLKDCETFKHNWVMLRHYYE